ncbi:hypothetical protein OUZ56_023785 [Daphnia magna]|uniref:CxC3 like cysteine cluster domain-containing protein n=1 Tax=Daphnia magna TaxID=35525 RepID=A0ABR0B071_9CRUS|nr:hypothetical protein OUZ56_023785 [Daphnia magna]
MTQPVFFTLKMLTHLGSLSNMTHVQVDPVLPYSRFNLNAASFTCHNPACGATNEASLRNYVNAGYWPGSPKRTCTLFSQSYMVHWFHTKHQIPSTAATPGKMSSEGGRWDSPLWGTLK